MNVAYIGQRRSYSGVLGTVRYVGPLPGTAGSWLGIEWDDPCRGKHNGTFQGEQIFKCLNVSATTAASFIRASRIPDPSRTLLQAIKHKYGGPVQAGLDTSTDTTVATTSNGVPIEISGKLVEEVGFEKIREQQAALEKLEIVLVDELCVRGLTLADASLHGTRRAQQELLATCPNIAELDVGWSLIERWQDVANICSALPKLRVLKVSSTRLNSFETEQYELASSPFRSIRELQLNENLLLPDQLWQIFWQQERAQFPNLKTLSLSQNALQTLGGLQSPKLRSLETLILESNSFHTLEVLWEVEAMFPNLDTVSLQSNLINDIFHPSYTPDRALNCIHTLNLADNRVSDYAFIDKLSAYLPHLTALRISNNPLYEEQRTAPSRTQSNAAFSLTLARIPSLRMLNYTAISDRDREEGEIYYISTTSAHLASLLTREPHDDLQSQYQLYTTLCGKHDREPIWTHQHLPSQSTIPSPLAPGTLAARLIHATFYTSSSPEPDFHRSIPRTIPVYSLKSLLARVFHLRPLSFRLIYESNELDPVRDDLFSTTRDWEKWGDWDVDCVDHPEEEGGEEEEEGVVYKDGKKWKRREVEIVDGTRAWGDAIEGDVNQVRVRVELL